MLIVTNSKEEFVIIERNYGALKKAFHQSWYGGTSNLMIIKVLLKYALKKFAKNQTFRGCSLLFSGLKATEHCARDIMFK